MRWAAEAGEAAERAFSFFAGKYRVDEGSDAPRVVSLSRWELPGGLSKKRAQGLGLALAIHILSVVEPKRVKDDLTSTYFIHVQLHQKFRMHGCLKLNSPPSLARLFIDRSSDIRAD